MIDALKYFLGEASVSLWRGRRSTLLSTLTIAAALFVLAVFLVATANLERLVERWGAAAELSVYLRDDATAGDRAAAENALRSDRSVSAVEYVSKDDALTRFRRDFPDLASATLGAPGNPFPASLEVSLKPGHQSPAEVERLAREFGSVPGVREIQYDLLWVERLATGVRLVRGVGTFLGGILILAGVFTISNVIRLTIYAREDELDIMRLVGATQAYVKGPFVAEGMIQGGLGGLVAVLLLWGALAWLSRDLASSDFLGRTAFALPAGVAAALVVGGMAVGVVGSMVSHSRLNV